MEIITKDIIRELLPFITGGAIWEGLKTITPEIKKYFEKRSEASSIFNKNIDPILKSADELFGKLTSLAKEDFKIFLTVSNNHDVELKKIYVYYLFSQFWARLEILRIESDYISLTRKKQGKSLLKFITAYEARKNRILDRSYQRRIGEALIEKSNGNYKVISLHEFTNKILNRNPEMISAILPLDTSLHYSAEKHHRQKILIFGIIVCSLIEYFDPKHKITRKREIYLNKLSVSSKREIECRILNHYLDFIKNKTKYYR